MFTWLFTKTPLTFLVQSLWRDEAFSYFLAKKNILEILILSAKDFSPPLYHLILHFWIKIFGGSEIALRSLSIVFFWATIYVVFLFLNDIFKLKLKKSFFYLLLFIINPLLTYYAFEVRMYSLFAFLSTLSFYTLFKKNSTLYILSSILGLYTHYFMIFVIIGQFLFLTINRKKSFSFPLLSFYWPIIAFVPWILLVVFNGNLPGSFWINKPSFQSVFGFLGIIYTGNESSFYVNNFLVNKINTNIFFLTVVLVIILIYGYFYHKKLLKKERLIFQFVLIWGLIIPVTVGVLSFIKPVYFPRYLIFATIGFLFTVIFIIEKLPTLPRILLIIVLFILTVNYQRLEIEYKKKADMRTVLAEIKAIAKENDSVYVSSELDFFTAQYYFEENKVYIWGKSYNEIPNYVGKVLIPKEKIASTLPFYPKKAYVLSPDGQYSIQAMY
ncbi:hypothetical protein COY13_04130 [Candidatus Roizmanbacteria bacterium CG_4_10_14_0_2_um_filter_36_35]|uniref:Uncharacterized protein n=4 Tax=Candidatus Roizmaniibacteriota TaxID=1752723 RepID=A0A2M7BVI7_9BACT|nr:MAG: hypothetical protein COV86_01520 [Candidatus Roizmanbacteria bacterium CG11_big_fil_rev_8_21_14_0_20_35_14]PIV10592.1 MAG: hypothetical protein COS50_04690 [Candidatus Roizmanbacteria bacterium CG03_land_8_20_14_0_80_35_26]PIZ67055.1 MAG: hypothetical protein COY13_04130 [Candidatus Roizmanbacteria bacterium CG_4_10_14_0_2_um_filter_36_35]PJC32511.1 MAG: hypothetical protein CO049_02800 [Candidatus Roizmanbacteria bacterium CG_4_9_14_0_2_um_filter_36_12]PJC80860.1 MAG: hypothetical prot